jgi:Predicted membrane protein (DUF2207)
VFEVQAQRVGQHDRFEIAAAPFETGGIVAVRDRHHLLGDDRSVIELPRDVVRSRADHLHTPRVRLSVRTRPHERRQERMMDIDHPTLPLVDKPPRQHAHVASENNNIGRVFAQQLAERLFLALAISVNQRTHLERHIEARHEAAVRVVVRRDHHDTPGHLTQREAHQEITEAMALAGREERDPRPFRQVVHVPLHVVAPRDRGERVGKFVPRAVNVELDPLQEQLRARVGVLIGFHDVAACVRNEGPDARDDSRPVGALEQQRSAHGQTPIEADELSWAGTTEARPNSGCLVRATPFVSRLRPRGDRGGTAMIVAAEWTTAAVTWGVLAIVALVAYFVILAMLAISTRPRVPAPGPPVMDVPGTEPPAVAAFLVNGWKVPRAAVPATLIDLAARHLLTIDEVGPDDFNVRVRNTQLPSLTAYERRVYDHVRGLADARGVVPCRALTTGPSDKSRAWWNGFRKEVRTDARRRGLSRNRWRGWESAVLALTAAIPATLGFVSLAIALDETTSKGSKNDSGWLYVPIIVWFVLIAIPRALRADRETPRGSEVAARWMGLARYLRDDAMFADYPVAAVAIWERYLSYGAAFGIAHAALRALPMGAESIHEAWSKESGEWRLLHVEYPRWPPQNGRAPGRVAFSGVTRLVVAAGATVGLLVLFARTNAWSPGNDPTGRDLRRYLLLSFTVALVIAILWVVSSVILLSYALPDLKKRRHVHGRLLRLREETSENGTETWIAVDDGTNTRVLRAWRLGHAVADGIVEGSLVDVTVSPRLGYVEALSPVTDAGLPLPARHDPPATGSVMGHLRDAMGTDALDDAPTARAVDLDIASIAATTGVHLSVRSHSALPGAGIGREMWELDDGAAGRVLLRRDDAASWTQNRGCLFGMHALSRFASRRGQRIAGVGKWAAWSERRSMLTAYDHGAYVSVIVSLDSAAPTTRRDVAVALARQVV